MGYEERPQQTPMSQFGGLNVVDNELGLPDDDSPLLLNVDLHPAGSLKKRLGCAALTPPTGEKKIEAVMPLVQPDAGTAWVYCIAGGKIYRTADPATWAWSACTSTPAYTLPTQTTWGRENSRYLDGSTERQSVLYLPRSNGAPLIATGGASATNDIVALTAAAYGVTPAYGYPIDDGVYFKGWKSGSNGAPNHWPTHMRLIGLGRGSRMFAWGFADDKGRIDYSEMDVPYHFMRNNMATAGSNPQPLIDGGWFYPRPGDGDEVTAVVDMFSYMVVFKKHRTLIYSGEVGSDGDFTVAADFPVGCVSDRAWAKVGNDLLFWSYDGIRALSAVQEYGDLAQADLSFKIASLVRAVVPGGHERICCYHDVSNARVVWFCPLSGNTKNDAAFVYYYNAKKWSKWNGDMCEVIDVTVLKPNAELPERIVAGTYDAGLVQVQSGYADIAADVVSSYTTNWLNFGPISDNERAMWLDVFFGDGGTDVDIYFQTDLNDTWTQITRTTKSFGGSGTVWGKFIWGTAVWGVPGRAHRRYELDALFGMIRFKFTKTGTAGFEIMGYRPEIRLKGPRA
jgi:hypothetical protein